MSKHQIPDTTKELLDRIDGTAAWANDEIGMREALEVHHQILAEAGYVVSPVARVSVYGTTSGSLYNRATDSETGPKNFEADSMIFWVLEYLQSLGLPIEIEDE